MQVAISGLPFSGKSTVFKALVEKSMQPKSAGSGKVQLSIGTIEARDERLSKLAGLEQSKKITYSQITLVDLSFMGEKSSQAMDTSQIREFEALALVIGAFSSDDPVVDLKNVECDLGIADLQVVQNRIARIKKDYKSKPKNQDNPELLLLERCQQALEEEKLIKDLQLNSDELKILSGFRFFTLKPMLVIANVSEEQLEKKNYQALKKEVAQKGLKFLVISALLETEIKELAEEERPAFMKEMGLASLAQGKFIKLCFASQDLISFFTVGKSEARAWPIRRGTSALEAAGCIHSDIERGFIRAEIISYEDFITCGSFARAREKGVLRLESKEYIVQDGDIVNIKFNV